MTSTCNFVRVLAARTTKLLDVLNDESGLHNNRSIADRYEIYLKCTEHFEKFKMSYNDFRSKVIRYESFLSKPSNFNNNKHGERKLFIGKFGYTELLNLSQKDYDKHSFRNCAPCKEKVVSLFERSTTTKFNFEEGPQDGKKFIRNLFLDLQEQGFESKFDMNIKDAVGSELNMVPKTKYKEKTNAERSKLKNTMHEISTKFHQNSLENILKENISFSQWDRQRKMNALEVSKDSRHRSSIGNLDNYSFDKDAFLDEAAAWPLGAVINWSDIARRYNVCINGIKCANGGQVLKNYAQINGIDVDNFNLDAKISGRDYTKQRRQKKKLENTTISLPSAPSSKSLKIELQNRISNGEYLIGDKIVPNTNTKLVYKHGTLVEKKVDVYGRKIPMEDLLQRELERAEMAGILRATYNGKLYYMPNNIEAISQKLEDYSIDHSNLSPEEKSQKLLSIQTTRHIKQWSDHGVVASKGHYLHMIQILYDEAVFLTDKELRMANPNSKITNVQSFVEQPQRYIFAEAPSSTTSCLKYAKPQMDDIENLNKFSSKTSDGFEYSNVLRVTSVDGPERQLKTGHQKGGNFRCVCGVAAKQHRNIAYCYKRSHKTLQEKRDLLMKGKLWKKSTCTIDEPNPMKIATKVDLKKELIARKEKPKSNVKTELNDQIKEVLEGQQRFPDLLFDKPSANFDDLNLSAWEVPEMEFMHDFTNMFSNIMDELPFHIENQYAKKEIEALFFKNKGERQHFRGCDARLTAIHFASLCLKLHQEEKISDKLLQLSQTIVEISKIGYSSYGSRNQKTILRCHNLCFTFALLLDELIPHPKKLSTSKWYGSHYHSLTVHFPMWFRIFSIKSLIPEHEEATFHKIRQITSSTSRKKSSHVIDNSILRLQFQKVEPTSFESQIKIQTKLLPKLGNTTFTLEQIKSHRYMFQAHF